MSGDGLALLAQRLQALQDEGVKLSPATANPGGQGGALAAGAGAAGAAGADLQPPRATLLACRVDAVAGSPACAGSVACGLAAASPHRRCRPLPRPLRTHPAPPPPVPPRPSPAAPLGLYGFALTTALLQGSKTQLAEPKGTAQMAVSFGFFFGGLAQFCAGLLEYQRRNTFGTVAFCW